MTDSSELKKELWLRVKSQTAGMMGLAGGSMHMRPMTPLLEKDSESVWFLTAPDNKLAQEGAKVHFTVQSPDERFYACVSGHLAASDDEKRLEQLWNVYASAFFEDGPQASEAVALELKPEEAEIWTIEANATQFAAEIASRSAFGGKDRPDLGTHDVVSLP